MDACRREGHGIQEPAHRRADHADQHCPTIDLVYYSQFIPLGKPVVTGEIRGQIDRIGDTFWSGGISNPLEVTLKLPRSTPSILKLISAPSSPVSPITRTNVSVNSCPGILLCKKFCGHRRTLTFKRESVFPSGGSHPPPLGHFVRRRIESDRNIGIGKCLITLFPARE